MIFVAVKKNCLLNKATISYEFLIEMSSVHKKTTKKTSLNFQLKMTEHIELNVKTFIKFYKWTFYCVFVLDRTNLLCEIIMFYITSLFKQCYT